MQVYAFDDSHKLSAAIALQGTDYTCPQCFSTVRVRRKARKTAHFFHLRNNRTCRQAQKGICHLMLQKKIGSLFQDATLEAIFPSIGRIADVARPASKIVYEIQYLPMSVEEAQSRIVDYASVGYTVIWILHDHTFNRQKRAPVEELLQSYPCYYSNLNRWGEGIIYDQLEGALQKGIVHLQKRLALTPTRWPQELQNRATCWPFCHEGDLLDRASRGAPVEGKQVRPSLGRRLCHAYGYLLQWILEQNAK